MLRLRIKIIIRTLPSVKAAGETVLDMGCGDGAVTQQLVEAGCDVVGVDSSPQLLEAARARGWVTQVCRMQALLSSVNAVCRFSTAFHTALHPDANGHDESGVSATGHFKCRKPVAGWTSVSWTARLWTLSHSSMRCSATRQCTGCQITMLFLR